MKPLIVIPCLNEEAHLPTLLEWLCADAITAKADIVVADGGSTDRSPEIVRAHAARDARVIFLPNPKRIQSAGVNLAFAHYGSDADCLIRIDAHADYPKDFLFRLIAAQRQTQADAVTVAMRAAARPGACFQKAAATAQNSVLGAGGSPHRSTGVRRWVDHGHHALFTAPAFRRAGGYDEAFTHNEDAELDARLIVQGARILLAADIVIDYYPRAGPGALAGQYFQYGAGRAATFRRHGAPLKLRQLAPLLVAPAAALALLAPFSPILAAPALLWLALTTGYGIVLGVRNGSVCGCASGAAAAIMHVSWSLGFFRGLVFPRF